MTKITVLGNGAMATACAILLAEHDDQRVSMWARNPDHAEQIQRTRENKRLLPGVTLSERIFVTADIELALRDCEYIVAAIPTQFLRHTLTEMRPHLNRNRPMISVIKGIENETFMRPSGCRGGWPQPCRRNLPPHARHSGCRQRRSRPGATSPENVQYGAISCLH